MKVGVPEKWDMEYDVVVVGWGSAGSAGGGTGHGPGAQGLLFEREPGGGGRCSCVLPSGGCLSFHAWGGRFSPYPGSGDRSQVQHQGNLARGETFSASLEISVRAGKPAGNFGLNQGSRQRTDSQCPGGGHRSGGREGRENDLHKGSPGGHPDLRWI